MPKYKVNLDRGLEVMGKHVRCYGYIDTDGKAFKVDNIEDEAEREKAQANVAKALATIEEAVEKGYLVPMGEEKRAADAPSKSSKQTATTRNSGTMKSPPTSEMERG